MASACFFAFPSLLPALVLGQFGFPSVMLSEAGKFAREFSSVVEASLPPARTAFADLFKLTLLPAFVRWFNLPQLI